MTTTFYLPSTTAAQASQMFGAWQCRVERIDDKSCNVVFFDKGWWDRFEEYAEANCIEYQIV